jgi:uncharacterized protein
MKGKYMIGKIHDVNDQKIFAACDKSLIEKRIITNDLEIYFSKSFYGEEELTIKQIIENIKVCTSSNIFGEKICSQLLENKIISKESIIYINKIPHIQIYNL